MVYEDIMYGIDTTRTTKKGRGNYDRKRQTKEIDIDMQY